jgi:hypothetical protein
MKALGSGPLDAEAEGRKIAFDQVGSEEKVLVISGFQQPRLSRALLALL